MPTVIDQIHDILENFPTAVEITARKIQIQLFPTADLIVDLSKYPKKPKLKLPKPLEKVLGDIQMYIPGLLRWDKSNPMRIVSVIHYIKASIETISGIKVHLSDELFSNVCKFAQDALPNEMFCVLRLVNGILYEYVMAPGMESDETTAVFFLNRIGRDKTLIASCHSHPNGGTRPSQADLVTFRKKPVNIILGKPFNVSRVGVYNQLGESIPFELNIVDFSEDIPEI